MKYKIYLITFFSLLFMFFLPNKTSANDIQFCTYGDTRLILPVTVGLEIYGIDQYYPFDRIRDINYTLSKNIYDSSSCNSSFDIPYINTKQYLVSYKYFYIYNSSQYYTDSILQYGVYSVEDLDPPNIWAFSDTVYANVDKYLELDDIYANVNAYDQVEGSIIPEIIYDGYSENYNTIGEYSIIFQACDSKNHCSKKTITIHTIDNTSPTINGEQNLKSYMSNPLTIGDIQNKLKAEDNHDKDITQNIELIATNYNSTIPGTYYANFNVCDSSNNCAHSDFEVEIKVLDDIVPTLEGPTFYNSYLSAPINLEFVISNLIGHDNVDSITHKNIYAITDTFSKNYSLVGTYKIVFGAYDNSGNESLPYPVIVNVIDNVAPVIDGKKEYTSYMSAPLTATSIKSTLIAYDSHDGNLYDKLDIIEDSYSKNIGKIGVYNIIYTLSDYSGNQSEPFNVKITHLDDVAPIIEGNNLYNVLSNEKLDSLSIKLSLTATDNVDGDLSSNIELDIDTYSDNFNKPGDYYLSFYVVDKTGNISPTYKVKVKVNEDLRYIDHINNSRIFISTEELKSDEEIIKLLGLTSEDFLSIKTIENTYSLSPDKEGEYIVTFQLEHFDYSKELINVTIVTYNEQIQNEQTNQKTEEILIEEKKETIFQKIISFFKNLFTNIANFFKRLFRKD